MKTLLTRTRSTAVDTLPGLVGRVRERTAGDPTIGELYRVVMEAGRGLEVLKLALAAQEEEVRTAGGDVVERALGARAIKDARTKVTEQERTVTATHAVWSEAVIAAMRPEYRDQVRRKAAALTQASAIEIEHDEFIASLRDSSVAGFTQELRPMNFGTDEALRLDRPFSRAALWAAEARSFGLLD